MDPALYLVRGSGFGERRLDDVPQRRGAGVSRERDDPTKTLIPCRKPGVRFVAPRLVVNTYGDNDCDEQRAGNDAAKAGETDLMARSL